MVNAVQRCGMSLGAGGWAIAALCLSLNGGPVAAQVPDLIQNNLLAELVQVDLFFGRDIPGGGTVSEEDFAAFLETEVTARFPNGLTVWEADGQYRDASGDLIIEPAKVVRLVIEDTPANEAALLEVIQAYIDTFNQESVMVLVDEDVHIEFVPDLEAVPATVP